MGKGWVVWGLDRFFEGGFRGESKSVHSAACEKEQRRNTGILHFVQDDDFKPLSQRRDMGHAVLWVFMEG